MLRDARSLNSQNSVGVWACGCCSPLELRKRFKGRKVSGPDVRHPLFIPALLSPDITNLNESLYTVSQAYHCAKGRTYLIKVTRNTRRCGKHGAISQQVSLLQNAVCLPQTMDAVVPKDGYTFCPLTNSMRGELHWCRRKPDSAQGCRSTAMCCS